MYTSGDTTRGVGNPQGQNSLPRERLRRPRRRRNPYHVNGRGELIVVHPLPGIERAANYAQLRRTRPTYRHHTPQYGTYSGRLHLAPVTIDHLTSKHTSGPSQPRDDVHPAPGALNHIRGQAEATENRLPSVPPARPQLPTAH